MSRSREASRRTPRRCFATLAALGALVVTAACSSGSSGSSGADSIKPVAAEQPNITVGVLSDAVGDAPFFMAAQEGAFTAAGLNVTVKVLTSNAQGLDELQKGGAAGGVDIVYGDYPTYCLAQITGAMQIHIVAEGYLAGSGSLALLGRPGDTALSNPANLARQRIAVDTDDLTGELALYAELQTANLTTDNVTLVPMPMAEMADAVRSGQVAAAVMSEPQVTQAEQQYGLTEFIDLASGPNASFPLGGYFTSQTFSINNHNTLVDFTEALDSAQQQATNRTVVEPVLRRQITGLAPQVSAVMAIGSYPTTLNPARLQRVADLLVSVRKLQLAPVQVANLTAGSLNVS